MNSRIYSKRHIRRRRQKFRNQLNQLCLLDQIGVNTDNSNNTLAESNENLATLQI